MSLIYLCMHSYASIRIMNLFWSVSSDHPVWALFCMSLFRNVHRPMFHHIPLSRPFCNPYRLHCNPKVWLLIMSVLHSPFPASIDWSCPMRSPLYLCPHNPQACQAKIIVRPQRTHKSHIHCVLEKSFKMAVSVGSQKHDNKVVLCLPHLFHCCIYVRQVLLVVWLLFLIRCKLSWCQALEGLSVSDAISVKAMLQSILSLHQLCLCFTAFVLLLMFVPLVLSLFYWKSVSNILFLFVPTFKFCFHAATFC